MFADARSKSLVFLAHCILNQNSISDGTADYPGAITEIMTLLGESHVGIVQMPCPELHCLGLDRGDREGGSRPVVEENTRIRTMMGQMSCMEKIGQLVQQLVDQISEYQKHRFIIRGIVGINRSPSCGVNTTSMNNQEVEGEGVFIRALRDELTKNEIDLHFVGIKAFETERAVQAIQDLVGI